MADELDMWRSGQLCWRAVWVRTDGSLVVNGNRYAARSWEGFDPEKARLEAQRSRPSFFVEQWTGQTVVVQQTSPWDDEEAKALARQALGRVDLQ